MHPEHLRGSTQDTPLAGRVGSGADGAEIALAVADIWRDMEALLRPIIGQRGVRAIYQRSVHAASAAHPWLAPQAQDPAGEMDLAALQSLFAKQPAPQALACANALLLGFHGILSSLIGPSLTSRLLQVAWGAPAAGMPTQDHPQ
jgi:hypothetical protein